ncbi:DUF6227 family protein [Streptomyces sp. JW3]|uniref:DUF6227 family protein n=1 Tax=Streptomyces sp. JW3 TaxID=3456955 RepID=UPI003FA46545
MSVPYETAAYEPSESPESPQEHLARLLGRALNSFELPDDTLGALDCALAHDASLHSAHHSAGLHRETYRHTWLLVDGSALTLWELVYNTTPGGAAEHEVYVDDEELRAATARLPLPPDAPGPQDPWGPLNGLDPLDPLNELDPLDPLDGPDLLDPLSAPGLLDPLDGPDFELPVTVRMELAELFSVPVPQLGYLPDGSADHARRLLRRAENADRPGADTAERLTTAFAHQITQAFGRPGRAGRAGLPFSLYEHAFLLRGGEEVSLWEVEHTATPDGRHMCEVYVSEDAARRAMERRAARLS